MTNHEKKLLGTGLALGLVLAFVAYSAMRLWFPDRIAAQSQEAPILKYEAAPEQAASQRTEQVQADASVSSIQLNQKEQYDRLIVITDEKAYDKVSAPQGKGYVINVASYKNGIGYGRWTHIDGWSEAVVEYIRTLEEMSS